jgi:hypothetical protein
MMVVLLFGAGCQAMTGKTAGENVDDASITARVKAKLVAENAANLTRVQVVNNLQVEKRGASLGK